MKKYEYMTVDLSAEPSFNVHIKLDRYIEKLNEYGKQSMTIRLCGRNLRSCGQS